MHGKLPGLPFLPADGKTRVTLRPLADRQDARIFAPDPVELPERGRRRIWEISANLHCSIVGTCLTTADIRQLLVKMQLPGAQKETDHQLHGRAVLLAGQKDAASRLLQKVLDRRHRSAINQFARAKDAAALRKLWDEAVQRAEIPGGYWAILTHPETTEDLVRDVFGEVHMLSHLVGAANRADIRRLRELEAENAALAEKIARQQRQLRDAVVSRDATITSLRKTLAEEAAQRHAGANREKDPGAQSATAVHAVDLQRRLSAETRVRERIERHLESVRRERDNEREQRLSLERRELALEREVESAEATLARLLHVDEPLEETPPSLAGVTLLYVGGRAHQIAQLRRLAEQSNAAFLHHDGGLEDRSGLLEALVARADCTVFPVDCVSHNAVATVKRVSRAAGKPYLAIRSSGLTSFAVALRSVAVERPAGGSGPMRSSPAIGSNPAE